MDQSSRTSKLLWLILTVALGLRLLGAWFGNMTYDESAHFALSETIDFHPDRFHLVFRTLDHPLLSIYVLKLSAILFGDSNFGLRILHVLFGTATVGAVYALGRRVFDENAGLWAAALLAVDQFHISWSRSFMPEVLMLFFSSLAMLKFLDVIETRKLRDYVLLGAWLGLAYLGKETGILMLPIVWGYLILTARSRSILWDGRWYLAHVVFLIVIAPDVLWNLAHFSESYLHRDSAMLAEPLRFQMKSFSLYLGELFRHFIGESILDRDYIGGNLWACHWPAGLFYLIAALASLGSWKDLKARLMIIAFYLVFGFFTVLPGLQRFDPFWWASLSLIPAAVLAGGLLAGATNRHRIWKPVFALGLCYLTIHVAVEARQPGNDHQRLSVQQIAARSIMDARLAVLERNDMTAAEKHLIYAVNIAGPSFDAYYLLADIHFTQGDVTGAEAFLLKCLTMNPESEAAKDRLEQIRSQKRAAPQ